MSDLAVPALSIVIPAYNEESRLPATLESAARVLPTIEEFVELIIADDGSTDGTAKVVEAKQSRFPFPLQLLRLPHRGKGHAVRRGMLAARGELRMLCDADLAMPFEDFPRLIRRTREVDVVIGSRQIVGAQRFDESRHRHLMGRLFNGAVHWITGLDGILDTQCGYKVFRERAALRVFERALIDGFAFDVEALCIAREQRLRIMEVPIAWRSVPASSVRPGRDSWRMLTELFRIRRNLKKGRYR